MEFVFPAAIVCALVSLNVWATFVIVRDSLSTTPQKIWQLLLVWLLPVIGALITLAMHRLADEPSRRYRQPRDPGDDFAMSARSYKNIFEVMDGD